MKHKWSKNDDIVALYLYLYGEDMLDKSIKETSEKLGMTLSSLKMRIANFKSVDGKGGLDNAAKQTVEVYREYKNLSKEELVSTVRSIIE